MKAVSTLAGLTLTLLGVGAAWATAVPPTGTISCTYSTGTLSFKPGLGTSPSTKAVKVKGTVLQTNATCNNSGVSGGKFPITAASVKLTAKTPVGADCTTLATAPALAGKVQVKFWGLNPSNKLATVAVDNTTVASVSTSGLDFTITTAPIAKGGFVGKTLHIHANAGALTGACTDADPLTGVTISGTVTASPSGAFLDGTGSF